MPPSTRILRAVIAAIRPRGHGFDQPIDDDVLGDIQRFFPYLPWPLRLGLPLGLWLVELGPPLFARRWCRVTSMAPGEAGRYLAAFEHAGRRRSELLKGARHPRRRARARRLAADQRRPVHPRARARAPALGPRPGTSGHGPPAAGALLPRGPADPARRAEPRGHLPPEHPSLPRGRAAAR